MKENELLIKALRNALIQLKIYEMQVAGYTDKEILEFSEKNVVSIRDIKSKDEFFSIMDTIENVGLDICQKFDISEISLFFGVDTDSMCREMEDSINEDVEFINMSDDDPFLNNLLFHTIHEMITDGDFPDRIPKELITKSLEFFSGEEEFGICKDIKEFSDNNKRLIVSDMTNQEFEQWQRKNVWKFHA